MEERLITEAGLPFEALAAAPILGTGWLARIRSLATLARGTAHAWRALSQERPDVILVTGGYVSVPLAVAAWLRRVPLAVYLPDALPGQAVRWIGRLADRIFLTAASAVRHLPAGKVVVTGYPVRPAIRQADRRAARERLGVPQIENVVLVVGGSQGAHRLNEAVMAAAPQVLPHAVLIHATGPRDLAAVTAHRRRLQPDLASRWHISPFLAGQAMADALAAADLAVCRAGAACLGELPARGLPAVLVPLAIAAGHQMANARLLAEADAAVILPDEECDGPRLEAVLLALLADQERRQSMRDRARSLDHPDAALHIANGLLDLAGKGRLADA